MTSSAPLTYGPRDHSPLLGVTVRFQDHIGGMGLVAEYFADDEPMAISSRRVRRSLKKNDKNDPASTFGNTRGVPVPEWYQEDVLEVGGLRFRMEKIHIHMSGDYAIFLDKHDKANAAEGACVREGGGGNSMGVLGGHRNARVLLGRHRRPLYFPACASLSRVCVRSEQDPGRP